MTANRCMAFNIAVIEVPDGVPVPKTGSLEFYLEATVAPSNRFRSSWVFLRAFLRQDAE
jgi:hypothetical protein